MTEQPKSLRELGDRIAVAAESLGEAIRTKLFKQITATYVTRRDRGIVIPVVTITLGTASTSYELNPRLTHWGARRVAERELARIAEENRQHAGWLAEMMKVGRP